MQCICHFPESVRNKLLNTREDEQSRNLIHETLPTVSIRLTFNPEYVALSIGCNSTSPRRWRHARGRRHASGRAEWGVTRKQQTIAAKNPARPLFVPAYGVDNGASAGICVCARARACADLCLNAFDLVPDVDMASSMKSRLTGAGFKTCRSLVGRQRQNQLPPWSRSDSSV